jgi:hypothetical protein
MRRFTNSLVLENEDPTPTPDTGADAGAGVDSLETTLLDVQDEAAEGDKQEANIADAEATASALEEIAEAMEPAVADGTGMDPVGAGVAEVAVEAFLNRLGMTRTNSPKLESFQNGSSRHTATRLAMEGIKEEAQKIWDAIKKALARLIEWAKGYWNKAFGAAEQLGKRAEALAKRAGDTQGTQKSNKVTSDSVAKALHINGSVSSVPAAIGKVKSMADANLNKNFDALQKEVEANIASAEKNGETAGFADEFSAPLPIGGSGSVVSDPTTIGYGASASESVGLIRGEELPGGKADIHYAVIKASKGAEAITAIAAQSHKIDDFDKKRKVTVKGEFATLSTSDCAKVAETVVEIAGTLKAFRNKSSKIEAEQKKALDAANKLSKAAESETDAGKAKSNKAAGKLLTAQIQQLNQLPSSVMSYSLAVSKAALDAAELSLKQYTA